MGFAIAHTVTLEGAHGHLVDVEVDLSNGVVATTMVGRADTAITEARDRCRSALINGGYEWPNTKRVTISLTPADVAKHGSHFDLAIALGVIAAGSERLDRDALRGVLLIGELTLDGRLRAVPGVLPMVMAAKARGLRSVVLPEPQAEEAALVPGIEVYGVRSLAQALAVLAGEEIPSAPAVDPLQAPPLLQWRGDERLEEVDLADLTGMADSRYALEVAAAGGHHLMLTGPRGAGKTSLAERLPSLLPDLEQDEALEVTAIHALASGLGAQARLITRPPFSAPHHTSSRASLLGGGTGRVRPGEVSKAHLGVLFLDEFPLFPRDVIDALRQPLESGDLQISRGEETARFPARAIVVLACNPCPCGNFGPTLGATPCKCGSARLRDYRGRISDPLLDRVDITRHVQPLTGPELDDPLAVQESSAQVRVRVVRARARQRARYRGTSWRLNADVPGAALRQRWPLDDAGSELLLRLLTDGRLTNRGGVRVHRLAWTIADLAGLDQPGRIETDRAFRLRAGEPLPSVALATRMVSS